MKIFCQEEGHFNKPFAFVCTSPTCTKNRILCSKCLTSDHKDCWNYTLEIEDIYKKSFAENINWIRNDDIRTAISTIKKYDLGEDKEQLLQAFRRYLDKEFQKVTDYFVKRIESIKDKIVLNLKEYSTFDSINVEDFNSLLKSIYDFDKFIEILDPLQSGEIDIKVANEDLNEFLEQTASNKTDQQDLEDLGNAIYSFTKDYLEVKDDIFDQFQRGIPFDIFDGFPLSLKTWKWDFNKKSSKIALKEQNTVAKKTDSVFGYTTVLGTIEMNEGRYQWEIEMISDNIDKQWIAFGIVDASLVKNLEDFSYKDAMGICSYGHFYNVTQMEKLNEYDNKTYFCDLDLSRGSFTISYEGTIIAKEKENLKDKKFIPFATLYRQNNSVRLIMLQLT